MNKQRVYILLLAILFCSLTSCGFHLPVQTAIPTELQQLYVQTNSPYSPFTIALEIALQNRDIQLLDSPEQAPVTLQILSEGVSRSVGAISFNTNTRQYNLTYRANFQLKDDQGEIIVNRRTTTARRSLIVDANQVLGSTNEEATMEQEMLREVIQKLLYQLGSEDVLEALHNAETT